ncbi:MAG: hypothetical protein WDW38_006913 [Sanguina aurantia]
MSTDHGDHDDKLSTSQLPPQEASTLVSNSQTNSHSDSSSAAAPSSSSAAASSSSAAAPGNNPTDTGPQTYKAPRPTDPKRASVPGNPWARRVSNTGPPAVAQRLSTPQAASAVHTRPSAPAAAASATCSPASHKLHASEVIPSAATHATHATPSTAAASPTPAPSAKMSPAPVPAAERSTTAAGLADEGATDGHGPGTGSAHRALTPAGVGAAMAAVGVAAPPKLCRDIASLSQAGVFPAGQAPLQQWLTAFQTLQQRYGFTLTPQLADCPMLLLRSPAMQLDASFRRLCALLHLSHPQAALLLNRAPLLLHHTSDELERGLEQLLDSLAMPRANVVKLVTLQVIIRAEPWRMLLLLLLLPPPLPPPPPLLLLLLLLLSCDTEPQAPRSLTATHRQPCSSPELQATPCTHPELLVTRQEIVRQRVRCLLGFFKAVPSWREEFDDLQPAHQAAILCTRATRLQRAAYAIARQLPTSLLALLTASSDEVEGVMPGYLVSQSLVVGLGV